MCNDKMYRGIAGTHVILEIDINTFEVKTYTLPKFVKIQIIYYGNEYFYITTHDNRCIVKWNPDAI